ncbi:MAG: PKD domain-containing protein [Sphingobacteriales bacterium]|nr:PKD domain-containing protein [Sphingobacteriales bacterium]
MTDWRWGFDDLGVIQSIQNPSFSFATPGEYNIKLIATNSNNCSDSVTLPATVYPSPVSNFSFDSVCGRSPLSLRYLATVAPPSTLTAWSWEFGDGTFENAIQNPQKVYNSPGIYTVKLAVRSSNQCVDTAEKQVKVFDFPLVDFDVSQSQCVGKEIQFTDISSTPDGTPVNAWKWFFSGQTTSVEQNPRYTFNVQGNYMVQLTATNSVGCTGTKLRSIAISSLPEPKFNFTPANVMPGETVSYSNQSPSGGSYIWDYGDASPLVNTYNPPAHSYASLGTYPITLIATDFRGCTDSLTKYILVGKAYLDGVMASINFTPNGDFYKVQVTIVNNSNIEITSLGLSLQLSGGGLVRENWTGSLMPGKSVVYSFTAEIKVDDSSVPVICANIDNINNNAREDKLDNNSTCKETRVGQFDVLNIYPNPAYETVNFGVMLPQDGKVSIRLIDILGKVLYTTDFNGVKGYNNLPVNTGYLNAAVYVAEVYYDGEIVRKKFARKDRR